MKRVVNVVAIFILLLNAVAAQSSRQQKGKRDSATSSDFRTAGTGAGTVAGGGTPGHVSKWTGVSGTSTFTLGDSNIAEDKFGRIGIGTASPTSALTVQGMIETTLGGLRFPDGTTQTTAGLGSIFHDVTLRGNGATGSPIGVNVPLELVAAAPDEFVLLLGNSADGGAGMSVRGGDTNGGLNDGGAGIRSRGGDSLTTTTGGNGGELTGGNAASGEGGFGLRARGGDSSTFFAGVGVRAIGGDSGNGFGGPGVTASGGQGTGANKKGGAGIFATGGLAANGAAVGLAGEFAGDVHVSGTLSKAGGSFKIDHPLDPENKYLYHSFVESPDMMNIYNGVTKLDSSGEAMIQLPEWFGALNRDFRYLLTPIGAPSPSLYIAEEIAENRFKIAGGTPGTRVSWQVTGIRQDAFANKHRIPVEETKPESERGTYLHPESFGQPETRAVVYVQHPQLMDRQQRTQANRKVPGQN